MGYTPRKPGEVGVWEHAVQRWCERIEKRLDWTKAHDYKIAEQHLKDFFYERAEFVAILENGRFLFAYLSDSDDSDVFFVLEGANIVTVWDRHPADSEIEQAIELSRWKVKQKQKTLERLYGRRSRVSRRDAIYLG